MANSLAQWSGSWKKNDWKIANKEIWRTGMWIDFSKQVKKCGNICLPCECTPKGDYSRVDVNNLMDRMIHPVDTHKPLSPDSSVIFQGVYEPSSTLTSFHQH